MNPPANSIHIILASQSPRRKQLLEQIGLTPHIVKVDVLEEYRGEPSVDYVRRLATDKARAGCEKVFDSGSTHFAGLIAQALPTSIPSASDYSSSPLSALSLPIIGADTIVVHNNQVLEKPHNQVDAQAMLLSLSGQAHEVITAVAVIHNNTLECIHVSTQVSFRDIDAQEALRYWQTGEPQDKAGGYGIQGLGAVFVSGIVGSYSNVVGLPLFETAELLARLKVKSF